MKQESDKPRQLSRHETHDLSMIIKDRTKVLKAHAEEQALACLADFEKKLAEQYDFDQDEVWKAATEEARKAIEVAQDKINKQCAKLGIPKTFAPRIMATWQERGENALQSRRVELRRVAKSAIDAMKAATITKIEKQSLDLRTQVVGMGILSADAKMFLESLAPVEESMHALSFTEIEKRLEAQKSSRPRLSGNYRDWES